MNLREKPQGTIFNDGEDVDMRESQEYYLDILITDQVTENLLL